MTSAFRRCVSARPRCTLFLFTKTRIRSNDGNLLATRTQRCQHAIQETTLLLAGNKLLLDKSPLTAIFLYLYFHSWKASHTPCELYGHTAFAKDRPTLRLCTSIFKPLHSFPVCFTYTNWKKKKTIKESRTEEASERRRHGALYLWRRTFTLCTCARVYHTVQCHLAHFSTCLWVFDDVTSVAALIFSHRTTITIIITEGWNRSRG